MKCLKNDFSIHKNFLITTIINLFYFCKKVFILLVIWVIGKHLMKHNYLEKKFYSPLNMEDITDADYAHAKRVSKDVKIKNLRNM